MKLHEIINAVPALNKLGSSDMKLSEAYKLQKLLTTIQVEIDFFNKNQLRIVEEHGVIQESGDFTIEKDNRDSYIKAMDELAQTEVESVFAKMKIITSENIQLSANDITVLMPFVEFTEGT